MRGVRLTNDNGKKGAQDTHEKKQNADKGKQNEQEGSTYSTAATESSFRGEVIQGCARGAKKNYGD